MQRLNGKVAVVTGSTQGLGVRVAERFAEEGASVLIVGRNRERAERVAASINGRGGVALACAANVASEDDVRCMVATALSAWGRIDILVNNAAKLDVERDACVTELDVEEWNAAFAVNATGAMLCCKHVIPEMIRVGGGSIINSSSGRGQMADASRVSYAASKSALVRLGQHVAVAYGRQGVRSNTLVLGLIETEAMAGNLPPRMREIIVDNTLVGRVGTPDDVANAMVFFASDESSYITGITINVDGGTQAHPTSWAQTQEELHKPAQT